ncbi:unnamed protein product [Tilletia caries]|nr:hypothetical protein CF336_g386 [Tilletia laevis]CAD6884442.1 unnamed protein product [Tilletia caries]CAD6983651.1 unnamed protein product [Tilletia controversa]CAD7068209.1 unnamed protein product [Tilletia caries]
MVLMIRSTASSRAAPVRQGFNVLLSSRVWGSRRTISNDTSAQLDRTTIAVLGGGITGLTSALVLARRLPKDRFRIVLVEKEKRLGGWVQSDVLPLTSDAAEKSAQEAKVAVVEGGPRSLRPRGYSGMVMLDFIRSLGLAPRLLSVSTTAPAAKNRFIYYPDRLHRLVSSVVGVPKALLTSPPLQGIVPSLAADFFTPARAWDPQSDESVDEFLTRRFGGRTELPSNLVSAVLHGIYAGDSRKLSVRALMPFLVRTEQEHGSLVRAILPKWLNSRYQGPSQAEVLRRKNEAKELEEAKRRLGPAWEQWLKTTSVYSFPRGIQEITDAMVKELSSQPHVEVRTASELETLSFPAGSSDVQISLGNGDQLRAKRVISTVPASALAVALRADPSSTSSQLRNLLQSITSVTVAVINVIIPASVVKEAGAKGRLLPVEGFGFLIPRSTPNNQDGILGVVFDSDTFPEQDSVASIDVSSEESHDANDAPPTSTPSSSFEANNTKLTVMLGGHWFDNANKNRSAVTSNSAASYPDSSELQERALRTLEHHLGIPPSVLRHPNTRILARLQKDCIPQYTVGHVQRMQAIHNLLASSEHDVTMAGRLILTAAPGEDLDFGQRTSSAADLPIDGAGAPKRLVATAPVASIAPAAGSETNTSAPVIDTSVSSSSAAANAGVPDHLLSGPPSESAEDMLIQLKNEFERQRLGEVGRGGGGGEGQGGSGGGGAGSVEEGF